MQNIHCILPRNFAAMAGLYIHIPFCKQACHYCDFHFSTNTDAKSEMLQALSAELVMQKEYLGAEDLRTIYFGGGTPSLLNKKELASLLQVVRQNFVTHPRAEITLEANPDDLTKSKLEDLRTIGINRLSIGIQSFQDNVLAYFNRAHTSLDVARCLADARHAGFDNISVDLIYGIPDLKDDDWLRNIRTALSYGPEHVSAYSLTVEEKTVFGKRQARGQLIPAPEEDVARQFELLMAEMMQAGYEHYEISNFSRPGKRSRHNTSYWEQKPYLGVGPSAHSYDGQTRQYNVSNNALYIKSVNMGKVPFERELLSRETLINEYIMTRLRTSDGLSLSRLSTAHGFNLVERHRPYLEQLIRLGKIVVDGDILRLSDQGKLLADKISADLFVIGE
jgi:oxygen-independent coproporphyrinogen-3 oxidase